MLVKKADLIRVHPGTALRLNAKEQGKCARQKKTGHGYKTTKHSDTSTDVSSTGFLFI